MQIRALSLAVLSTLAVGSVASAGYYIPGSYQGWSPPTSPLMTNVGGNVYEYTITGLTNGTVYEFKILNDTDNNPQWGDAEVYGQNSWVIGDSDGSVKIRLDLGPVGDGASPNTNRIGVDSTAWVPQVVGDFQNEAGGAGDWNPDDSLFDLNSVGGGLFSKSFVISNAGSYVFKVTDGTGWARQLGGDSYNPNASTVGFTTTIPNQSVTFQVNPGIGSIQAVVAPIPEPATLGALAGAGLLALRRRK